MGESVGEKSVASGISSPEPLQKKEGSGEIRQDFSSPTPVKKKEPSRIQSNDDELAKLPEKCVH